MQQTYIKIHPDDKVAVALRPLEAGTVVTIDKEELTLREDIAQGHKFALRDLAENEPVIKYGYPIGITKQPVKAGEWIHVHNMKTALGDLLTYTYEKKKLLWLRRRTAPFWAFADQTAKQASATRSGSSRPSAVSITWRPPSSARRSL